MRRRFTRLAAAALIAIGGALGLAAVGATPALAHDQLISYSAENGEIRLSFNNEVLQVGSEINVTGPDGVDVTEGSPEFSGPNVTQRLADDLVDGEYTAQWRIVSSDGHPIQGEFALSVEGGSIVGIEPVDGAEAEHDHEHADSEDHEHADEHATHEHDDATDDANDDGAEAGGPGVAIVIAVLVIAAAAVGGIITAASVRRRRTKANAGQTPTDTAAHSQPSQD